MGLEPVYTVVIFQSDMDFDISFSHSVVLIVRPFCRPSNCVSMYPTDQGCNRKIVNNATGPLIKVFSFLIQWLFLFYPSKWFEWIHVKWCLSSVTIIPLCEDYPAGRHVGMRRTPVILISSWWHCLAYSSAQPSGWHQSVERRDLSFFCYSRTCTQPIRIFLAGLNIVFLWRWRLCIINMEVWVLVLKVMHLYSDLENTAHIFFDKNSC